MALPPAWTMAKVRQVLPPPNLHVSEDGMRLFFNSSKAAFNLASQKPVNYCGFLKVANSSISRTFLCLYFFFAIICRLSSFPFASWLDQEMEKLSWVRFLLGGDLEPGQLQTFIVVGAAAFGMNGKFGRPRLATSRAEGVRRSTEKFHLVSQFEKLQTLFNFNAKRDKDGTVCDTWVAFDEIAWNDVLPWPDKKL